MSLDQLVSLDIANFQSLKSVTVEFGQFTVLVGPSSSGKSAVLRAIKAVVRNVNSPAAVSHGKGTFTVTATFGDCVVGVERGKAKSVYALDGSEYPKAGVKVPAAVANKLRMPVPQEMELFLAGQFDRPFLLAETGSTAAKVLGELTNATLLMESAREANIRRQRHSQVSKLRMQDVEAIGERIKGFTGLPEEKQRLETGRLSLDRARESESVMSRLFSAIKGYESSASVVESAKSGIAQVPNVQPVLLQAETSLSEVEILEGLINTLIKLAQSREQARADIGKADTEIQAVQSEEKQVLRDMGTCPVCGQMTGSI